VKPGAAALACVCASESALAISLRQSAASFCHLESARRNRHINIRSLPFFQASFLASYQGLTTMWQCNVFPL